MTNPRLQAVALACERDWRLLFEGLELDLGSGTLLQVAGPNGSGKTSLLRLLGDVFQFVLAEFDDIAVLQEMLFDRLAVDQCAIGTVQIFKKCIIQN